MPQGNNQSDELLEGIYSEVRAELTDETRKEFKPWHKPRKHYIRIYQWCKLIEDLIRELRLPTDGKIRYLGMPGEDFLDVRTLEGVCGKAGVKLAYLGFDSSAELQKAGDSGSGVSYELNLSRHEVASLGFVDPVVVRDRIEQAANTKSVAYEYVNRLGPFDVINIDLCDSLGGVGSDRYFDALTKIFTLQVNGRTKPWLFLIATRTSRDQIAHETKVKLIECIANNLRQNNDFAEIVNRDLELDLESLVADRDGKRDLTHAALVRAYILGIGKWMLQLLMNWEPKVKVKLCNGYSYRVHLDEPDMVSLAFRIEPIIRVNPDRAGLAPMPLAPAAPTEAELAVELASAVREIEDIDEKLVRDSVLMDKMIEKAAKLLASARYPENDYRKWARNSAPKITVFAKDAKGSETRR